MNGAKHGEYWVKMNCCDFAVLFPSLNTALAQQRINQDRGFICSVYDFQGRFRA